MFQLILKAYQEVAVMYALGHKRTFCDAEAMSALHESETSSEMKNS